MARSRPEFETSAAGLKELNLNKLDIEAGSKTVADDVDINQILLRYT